MLILGYVTRTLLTRAPRRQHHPLSLIRRSFSGFDNPLDSTANERLIHLRFRLRRTPVGVLDVGLPVCRPFQR